MESISRGAICGTTAGWTFTFTGGAFVAPTLVGVGSRAPLMHDGCAATLDDRFTNAKCGGGDAHGNTSRLSVTERGDLITFLKSL